jgi:C4-dicarboxylate-specific signal transduction histidine kinase
MERVFRRKSRREFSPFLTTKQTGKGVGLELAVSCGILERPNAGIEVHSDSAWGTTFTLALPSDRGRAAAATPAKR